MMIVAALFRYRSTHKRTQIEIGLTDQSINQSINQSVVGGGGAAVVPEDDETNNFFLITLADLILCAPCEKVSFRDVNADCRFTEEKLAAGATARNISRSLRVWRGG